MSRHAQNKVPLNLNVSSLNNDFAVFKGINESIKVFFQNSENPESPVLPEKNRPKNRWRHRTKRQSEKSQQNDTTTSLLSLCVRLLGSEDWRPESVRLLHLWRSGLLTNVEPVFFNGRTKVVLRRVGDTGKQQRVRSWHLRHCTSLRFRQLWVFERRRPGSSFANH